MSEEKQEIIDQLVSEGHELNKIKRLSLDKLKNKLAPIEEVESVEETIETLDEVIEVVLEDEAPVEDEAPSEAEKAFEEDELEALLEKTLKASILKRHMMKARFLTLLKLTLASKRKNLHGIQGQYKAIFPVPHLNNVNADVYKVYEMFKKAVKSK
jgi:hypothetical protein